MKRTLLLLILSLITVFMVNGQTIKYSDHLYKQGFSLKSSDQQGVKLNFSVSGFSMEDIDVKGEPMKAILLPDHFLPGDEGAPDLPGSGRYIALPEDAVPVLQVLSFRKEIYRDIDIAPAPRIPKDDERGPLEYNKNERIYSHNAFYPAEPFKLSEVTQVRGVDAVIAGITPFQYNPVTRELVVYRDIEIEISFEGGNGVFGDERLRSRWWDPILADLFVNYEQLPSVDYSSRLAAPTPSLPLQGEGDREGARQTASGQRQTGFEYLIICPDDPVFTSWADSIKVFRTMQGISTGVVTTTEVGGNTVAAIENYVNNAYQTWDIPPAAVLLLGDYGATGSTIISPIWDSYCVSDHIFADVNGDDEEEIIFARMTARNAAELEVMIRKAIDYERNPPTSPDFYDHPITALGWQTERWFQICSETVGGYFLNVQGKSPVRINAIYDGNPNVDPWSTATNTATVLNVFGPNGLGYIPASPSELGGWTGGTATAVNNALNAGSFLLQHRDHGYEEGWGEPDYGNVNINGLTNTDLSFIFSINCLTGKYNWSSECFAEKFHRYTYNGQPAGALGLIAASEVSYSFVNDTYVWGLFDNMFPDFLPAYGTTPPSRGMLPAFGNAAGKFFLKYSSWPYNTDNKEVTYNLFHHHGDAFTCLYSEVPQDLTVIHNPVQMAGLQTFTIQADEGALIGLSVEGELIGVGTGTGAPADIPIAAQVPPTIIDVVVTKGNYYRYHAAVQVIPPNGPFVVIEAYEVDDAAGNGNGKLDYTETVLLDVTLKNLGTEPAVNVMTSISSADEFITILDATAEAGTIAAGESAFIPGAFSVMAAGNVPDGHIIPFTLEASDADTTWTSSFTIRAFAPNLVFAGCTVSDVNGNNDGRLDPGETADLILTISNNGAADAYNVFGLLASADPFITIEADSAMFGDILQNTTVTDTFSVTASVITPPGHQAEFILNFTGDLGLAGAGTFEVIVGLFPILVLDLDPNANSGNLMKASIDELNIFSEYLQSIPEEINQYRAIFICLGTYSDNHELSESEAAPFVNFLNNGGNLYMEGADTWYYDDPTTLHPMFRIDGISDGSGDLNTINGITGTFTEGMSFGFTGENSYIDHIVPIGDAYNIFSNNSPAYFVTVANDAGTYRTIGAAFEFGGLEDNSGSTKTALMSEYLSFFGINPISEAPQQPVGDTIACANATPCTYTTQPVNNALYYIWQVDPAEAGTVEGMDTTVNIMWAPGFSGPATVTVYGMNDCGLGPASPGLEVDIYPLPAVPAVPAGPEYIDQFLTPESTYSTVGSEFSLDYEWSLEPAEAGSVTENETGMECTVTWSPEFTGDVQIKVRGLNDCGEGVLSDALVVTVANTVGIIEDGSGLKISINPNPNHGNFQIMLNSSQATRAQLKLYTTAGHPVWGPVDANINQSETLQINLGSIPEGLYLLKVETITGISQHKVLIIK